MWFVVSEISMRTDRNMSTDRHNAHQIHHNALLIEGCRKLKFEHKFAHSCDTN